MKILSGFLPKPFPLASNNNSIKALKNTHFYKSNMLKALSYKRHKTIRVGSVSEVTAYWLHYWGSNPSGEWNRPFATTTRPYLGSIQPPVHFKTGAFSRNETGA
jgi:hypothetical protein